MNGRKENAMVSIYVIDKNTKKNLGMLDWIPHRGDGISIIDYNGTEIEVRVEYVLHRPMDHAVLVFVAEDAPTYSDLVKDIKWDTKQCLVRD